MATDARISTGLPAHPKTKKLVRRLGPSGGWSLICLFLWAAANRRDGDLAGLSDEDIERAADWAGHAGEFVRVVRLVGFIEGSRISMDLWTPGKESLARICSKTWGKIRQAIFDRDGWRCVYCGASEGPFECDHIFPISRGGTNDKSNLATACKPCNRSKAAKTLLEWRH